VSRHIKALSIHSSSQIFITRGEQFGAQRARHRDCVRTFCGHVLSRVVSVLVNTAFATPFAVRRDDECGFDEEIGVEMHRVVYSVDSDDVCVELIELAYLNMSHRY